MFSGPLEELVSRLERLPGVGPKSASRIAFHILRLPVDEVERIASAVVQARSTVRLCSVCQNFTAQEVCDLCSDPKRDPATVCVVADPRDVAAIERIHEFRGRYHVLHGLMAPLDGVRPEDLKMRELVARLDGSVAEVIVATNATVEGDATAQYLANLLKPLGVQVTRLAHGMPSGSELEFADSATLASALAYRRPI